MEKGEEAGAEATSVEQQASLVSTRSPGVDLSQPDQTIVVSSVQRERETNATTRRTKDRQLEDPTRDRLADAQKIKKGATTERSDRAHVVESPSHLVLCPTHCILGARTGRVQDRAGKRSQLDPPVQLTAGHSRSVPSSGRPAPKGRVASVAAPVEVGCGSLIAH